MSSRAGAWWLLVPGGKRVRITAAGVLLGRSSHCDVVLADPQASRAQAIVVTGPRGPRLAVLGQGPTEVNGEPVERDRELAAGDAIAVPGLALEVAADAAPAAGAAPASWVLESSTSGYFGVARTPFAIHGGAEADLRIDGWPPRALRLHATERLEVEALVEVLLDGAVLAPGERAPLGPGSQLALAGERLTVVAGGVLGEQTTQSETGALAGDPPVLARVEFLPRGGRLTVRQRGGERSVYLADRRCDLIAALLQPPGGLAPGDYVPDEQLIPRIWPGRAMGRGDLNVLIHRTRRDLARADLDGARLLPRVAGGSATRFTLAPGARVELA